MAQFNLEHEDVSDTYKAAVAVLDGNMEQARNFMDIVVIGQHEGGLLHTSSILKKKLLESQVPRRLAAVFEKAAGTLVGLNAREHSR